MSHASAEVCGVAGHTAPYCQIKVLTLTCDEADTVVHTNSLVSWVNHTHTQDDKQWHD